MDTAFSKLTMVRAPVLVLHCDDPGGATSAMIMCAQEGFLIARLAGRRIALAPWHASSKRILPEPFALGFSMDLTSRACGCTIMHWAEATRALQQKPVAHVLHSRYANASIGRWESITGIGGTPVHITTSGTVKTSFNVSAAVAAIGSSDPNHAVVLHISPRNILNASDPFSAACTLVPDRRLQRIASDFIASHGLSRGFASVHLRLFDALHSAKMMRKFFVLPAAHAAAYVCNSLRSNRRPRLPVFLSATQGSYLDRSYVSAFAGALTNHSCVADVQLLDNVTEFAAATEWKDYHGHSPSVALLDQLVASRADVFVGTDASTFSQYIETLRMATRRASPLDIKICCRRSAFLAAWQPLNWSQVEGEAHNRCVKSHTLAPARADYKRCTQRPARLGHDVVQHLLHVPLPPEPLPHIQGTDNCPF